MQRSGVADLPLHGGHVPQWLAERMTTMGAAITEVIVRDYGSSAFLSRLSNPFWFQALGSVARFSILTDSTGRSTEGI
jgi:uncharacterized protein